MRTFRDIYNHPILVGDRVNVYEEAYGTVVEVCDPDELSSSTRPNGSTRSRTIRIQWDPDYTYYGNWVRPDELTVNKISEHIIMEFFAQVNRGEIMGMVGQAFLRQVGLMGANQKLLLEVCPGKAAKMIWEQYV